MFATLNSAIRVRIMIMGGVIRLVSSNGDYDYGVFFEDKKSCEKYLIKSGLLVINPEIIGL